MKYEKVNIGLCIEQRMNELGLNKSELARKLSISNQYINRLFAKESIDTDKLIAISEALDYDFFQLYRPIGSNEVGAVQAIGRNAKAANGHNIVQTDQRNLPSPPKSAGRFSLPPFLRAS
jgi:transcriptional regulator with XRE-family HTH domain